MKTWSLAERIVRVLDADDYTPELDDEMFRGYWEFQRERYRYWKTQTDFQSARRKARTETVQRIIDEFK